MGIVIAILVLLAVIVVSFFALFKYKNRRIEPDYFEVYQKQDTTPVGKVGIFATALIMPINHNHWFFHNIVRKIFKVVIPWPFNVLATKDRGVTLLDPHNVHAM